MVQPKGRARQFQDPDEKVVKDYDPEANGHDSDNGSASGLSDDENAGTEHYVTVGKSKLREKEGLSLGRHYRGSRVSRQALDEESDDEEDEDEEDEDSEDDEGEYDDPETADLEADTAQASDSEIDSDNALADSDVENLDGFVFRGSSKPKSLTIRPKKRAKAADFMSASEDEEEDNNDNGSGSDDDDEDLSGVKLDGSEDEDMDDGLDALVDGGETSEEDANEAEEEEESEDESEDESEEGGAKKTAKPGLATASNQSEVEKGVAIQKQRKIYDGLLNMRIRLQKALVAANTFPTLEEGLGLEAEAYEAAEEAAIKLLNTISDLRDNLVPQASTGSKRKRSLEPSMTTQDILQQIREEDRNTVQFREDRLEKWSRKVQSVNVAATSKLGSKPKTLVAALQEQLSNPENRLIKRTRVPRSCAPVQASKKLTESGDIYDDADFYQLLLKELVDQRTVETAAEQTSAVASVMLTASKEAKTRKVVDRKASKGRKMRFTVHEKLQNFMAPEDRRTWELEAIDRFFGTLFGQRMELNENDESEDDEMEAMYNDEGEGLRLFR